MCFAEMFTANKYSHSIVIELAIGLGIYIAYIIIIIRTSYDRYYLYDYISQVLQLMLVVPI